MRYYTSALIAIQDKKLLLLLLASQDNYLIILELFIISYPILYEMLTEHKRYVNYKRLLTLS